MSRTEQNYQIAKEMYAEKGVNTDQVLKVLKETPISVHCWQIDDLTGFENPEAVLSGGIAAFGNAPGKPRSREEYMKNLDEALSLIPGATKLALHAVYRDETGKNVERNALGPEHFKGWVDYAKEKHIGLDYNPTYFSHPMSESGFTLCSRDEGIRQYWIEHGKKSREIGAYFGKELGQVCVTNHWIGDGYKDHTIDKVGPRTLLKDSLDQIFAAPLDRNYNVDSVESKLFGLGSESYVPGSHEFYTNYAMTHDNCIVCMDAGHFHPTEQVSAKISSYLVFGKELMLHVSRPVRWDSDHVVMLDDETKAIMQEIVRYNALDRVHIGLDYFDASINRIAATALGARNARKALMLALLEPSEELIRVEHEGNLTRRLTLSEEMKSMPFGLVWDMFCEMEGVAGSNWLDQYN
ncbi:MAG: L-rhamnose isomerase [Lachnospiraceae bacterium]|nr:L-rhamnose isomerase [Lachnospiraceae bacterium]